MCIDGSVTGKKRDECITAFKERDYDVMIVSYKIGAESLNLTEARHVILTEAWWNSAIILKPVSNQERLQVVIDDRVDFAKYGYLNGGSSNCFNCAWINYCSSYTSDEKAWYS